MSDNKEKDIHYMLGKIDSSIESLHSDVSEIKEAMIPNGKERMADAEEKIQNFRVWKKTTTMLSLLFLGAIGWIEHKLNVIGGFFNG